MAPTPSLINCESGRPVAASETPTDTAGPKTLVVAVPALADAPASTNADVSDLPPPKVGDLVAGFRLIEELGRGTFARVFLAEQAAIGNRRVVVKIADETNPEAERLGRLQHPNVVPLLSVHTGSRFVLCMPYLGRRTLASYLAERAKAGANRTAEVRWALETLSALAGGLDHAHRRGILHLDMKPANVLLADDSDPMLLDFNLAHDTSRPRWHTGGTLAYMAPEQIDQLQTDSPIPVDERTDLYGFGVVAFELLTGVLPFPATGVGMDILVRHAAIRKNRLPSPREKNPSVTPAVEAIVHKLLAPASADRYQTARELKTDLDRHLADLPLVYAPEPSARERLSKWRRRNPSVPARLVAAVVIGLMVSLAIQHQRRNAADRDSVALSSAVGMQPRMASIRMDLASAGDPEARDRGRGAARELLARYSLPNDPAWRTREAFTRLPELLKPRVAADLGELLLLLAHADWVDAQAAASSDRARIVAPVVRLNEVAATCFDPQATPTFLAVQRATLTGQVVEPGEPRDSRDQYLLAVHLIAEGKYRQATGHLGRAIAGEPGHAAAHFALGYCRHQLGQYARALERYDTAAALLPDDPRPPFNRGLVYGLQQKHTLAEPEFALAIRLNPNFGEAYRNRAVARLQTTPPNLRGAEGDLTAALERGVATLQVLTLRGKVRTQLKDAAGAAQDRNAAAEYEPRTEGDYIVRGLSRLPANPAAALADFETATKLNPVSLPALQNQAHVLSDYLHDASRALAAVSRAAELFPDYAPARAGRAVLLARSGRRDDAHQEAEVALRLSEDQRTTYQVAGVYALTSATHRPDADRALTLLRQAVRDGFRDAATMETDPDLNPVRSRPEFTALLNGLKSFPR